MAIGIKEVFLVNAKGLQNTNFFGKISPYVVIQYNGQECKSNVAKAIGPKRRPTWDEKIKFKVEFPSSGTKYILILKIMDHHIFWGDAFIGQATIYVKDLLSFGVENGTAELPPAKYRVVTEDLTYGEVQVGVTFTLTVEEKTSEDYMEIGTKVNIIE